MFLGLRPPPPEAPRSYGRIQVASPAAQGCFPPCRQAAPRFELAPASAAPPSAPGASGCRVRARGCVSTRRDARDSGLPISRIVSRSSDHEGTDHNSKHQEDQDAPRRMSISEETEIKKIVRPGKQKTYRACNAHEQAQRIVRRFIHSLDCPLSPTMLLRLLGGLCEFSERKLLPSVPKQNFSAHELRTVFSARDAATDGRGEPPSAATACQAGWRCAYLRSADHGHSGGERTPNS